MQIKEIIKYLNIKCPTKEAIEKDPTGWQIGNNKQIVENVLLSLDCSKRVIKYAIENKCNLIITHHPLFWPDKKTGIEESQYQKAKAELLIKNKICVYSMHTNYDEKYLKQQLLNVIEPKNQNIINDNHSIILADLSKTISIINLIKKIKKRFDLNKVQTSIHKTKNKVKTIAIIPGAGGSLIKQIINNKIDLIITGEIKWSNWIFCRDYNQNIITIGHQTEQLFIEEIKKWLKMFFIEKDLNKKIFCYYEEGVDFL